MLGGFCQYYRKAYEKVRLGLESEAFCLKKKQKQFCFNFSAILAGQAGFRAERSTTKGAFDRLWHAATWATMKKYISDNLIQVIKTPP